MEILKKCILLILIISMVLSGNLVALASESPLVSDNEVIYINDFSTFRENDFSYDKENCSVTVDNGVAVLTLGQKWKTPFIFNFNTTEEIFIVEIKINGTETMYKKAYMIGPVVGEQYTPAAYENNTDFDAREDAVYYGLIDINEKKYTLYDKNLTKINTLDIEEGQINGWGIIAGDATVEVDYICAYTPAAQFDFTVEDIRRNRIIINTTEPVAEKSSFKAVCGEEVISASVEKSFKKSNTYILKFQSDLDYNKIYTVTVDKVYGLGDKIITLNEGKQITLTPDNVHGKVLMKEKDFERATALMKGDLKEEWPHFKEYLDNLSVNAPDYETMDTGTEELWMRDVGDDIFKLSLAYKMSGDINYFNKATSYVEKAITYPTWGKDEFLNNDLACAHLLIGISVYYDWLYDEIDLQLRENILAKLCERATSIKTYGWWVRAALQNHCWIAATSMAVTAAAIENENSALSQELYERAEELYDTTFHYISSEGSFHEGHGYLCYGLGYMLMYGDILKDFRNKDISTQPFLRNAGEFIINLTLPQMRTGSVLDCFDFSDTSRRSDGDFISFLAYMADEYHQNRLWEYVNYYRDNIYDKKCLWRLFMTYNPDTSQNISSSKPFASDRLYEGAGYGFSSSDKEGKNTAFAFKCGMPLGNDIVRDYPWEIGIGHNHPDQNSFLLSFSGRRIFTDDGYATAYTKNHNTLAVDGAGQYYDYTPGTIDSTLLHYDAKTTDFTANDEYMYAVGQAAAAYESEAQVQKYNRHFFYIKPDILIVLDDVALSSGSNNKELQLNFFTALDYKSKNGDEYLFDDGIVKMKAVSIGDGVTNALKKERNINKYGTKELQNVFEVTKTGTSMLQATAFVWGNKWENLKNISLSFENDMLKAEIFSDDVYEEKKIYTIDYKNNYVTSQSMEKLYFSLDYTNKKFTVEGSLPYGTYSDVAVKLTDPDGDVKHINQIKATGKEFSGEMPVNYLENGEYTVSVYNAELGRILERKLYVNADVKINNISVGYENGKAICSVSAQNDTPEDKRITIYLAKYDSEGKKLEGIVSNTVDFTKGEKKDNIKTELNIISNKDNIRVFVLTPELKPIY